MVSNRYRQGISTSATRVNEHNNAAMLMQDNELFGDKNLLNTYSDLDGSLENLTLRDQ